MARPKNEFWQKVYDLPVGQSMTVEAPSPESVMSWRSYVSARINAGGERKIAIKYDTTTKTVTFTHKALGAGDVFTSKAREVAVRVAMGDQLGYSEWNLFRAELLRLIERVDKLLVASVPYTPTNADETVLAGKVAEIVNVPPIEDEPIPEDEYDPRRDPNSDEYDWTL